MQLKPKVTSVLIIFVLAILAVRADAASIVVNDLGDALATDGKCTLREAINNANNNSDTTSGDCVAGSGVDTISFSLSGTVTLTSLTTQLDITDTDALTIDGKGHSVTITPDPDMDQLMIIHSGATLNLNGLYLLGTGVDGSGGIVNDGILNLTNSTLRGFLGGAITNNGTLFVVNSTFTHNIGFLFGGITNFGTATLLNSTLSEHDGSVYNGSNGTLRMRNSMLKDASPAFAHDCVNEGTIAENVRNIISDNTCDPYLFLTAQASENEVHDHGGPTPTIALFDDSPAIDQGDPATCASAAVNNLDQRGFVRPVDGDGDGTAVCDIGAFEYGSYAPITAAMDIQFCGNPNAFNCKKKGVVPVTLFGSSNLNVNAVNRNSIQLCLASDTSECIALVDAQFPGDRGNPNTDLGTRVCTGGLAHPDGMDDMDLLFSATDLANLINCGSIAKGSASAALIIKGQLNDGTEFRSSPQNNVGIDELLIQTK